MRRSVYDLPVRPVRPVEADGEPIAEGERNERLTSLAGSMRSRGMTATEIRAALLAVNRERCRPPLADAEVERIATSVARYEPDGEPIRLAPPRALVAVPAAAPWPEPLGAAAFHGPLGAMVRAVEDYTEADPVGILGTLLVDAACLLGDARTIHQGAWHAPRLFAVLVGETAAGRKGTATAVARDITKQIDPDYWKLLVAGLGSGEGLVGRFRRLQADGGTEHRALVNDSEFGRLLTVMAREGSTLSPILRDAWDGAPLGRTLARQDDLVHEHHVCLLAHITPRELRARLASVERDNGFANRFLWLLVRRQRLVPFPQPPGRLVQGMWQPVARAIAKACEPRVMTWTPDAAVAWEEFYAAQAERPPVVGILGAITARAEAQVTRLALTYALVDGADAVDVPHLEAAQEVWRYAVDSARHIFGESTGNRHADVLLGWLEAEGELTWYDARRELGLRTASEMQEAVEVLLDAGLAELVERPHPTGGRKVKVIRANRTNHANRAGPAHESEREGAA